MLLLENSDIRVLLSMKIPEHTILISVSEHKPLRIYTETLH